MIPKHFNSCDAILSGMTEEGLKILRNHIDNKLEKIKEERQARLDELNHRLANIIAEIQAEKGEIAVATRHEYGEEDGIYIGFNDAITIRVE